MNQQAKGCSDMFRGIAGVASFVASFFLLVPKLSSLDPPGSLRPLQLPIEA